MYRPCCARSLNGMRNVSAKQTVEHISADIPNSNSAPTITMYPRGTVPLGYYRESYIAFSELDLNDFVCNGLAFIVLSIFGSVPLST